MLQKIHRHVEVAIRDRHYQGGELIAAQFVDIGPALNQSAHRVHMSFASRIQAAQSYRR